MKQSDYFAARLLARSRRQAADTHAPTYYRSGANDGYWNASCTCGWQSKAWTHVKGDVVREYQAHLNKKGA